MRSTSTIARPSRAGPEVLRLVAGRRSARDRRARGPSLVRGRAVPSGTEIPPLRAPSPVPQFHRGGESAEPAGLNIRPDIRVCFLGDSFTLGTGDDLGLGWPGRVLAAERARGVNMTAYNLGIRGQTGAQIAERAASEVSVRISEQGDRRGVVISFGANDLYQGRPPHRIRPSPARGVAMGPKPRPRRAFVVAAPPLAEPDLRPKQNVLQKALDRVCSDFAAPFLDLPAAVDDWSP